MLDPLDKELECPGGLPPYLKSFYGGGECRLHGRSGAQAITRTQVREICRRLHRDGEKRERGKTGAGIVDLLIRGTRGSGHESHLDCASLRAAGPSLIATALYGAIRRVVWDPGANHSRGPDSARDFSMFSISFGLSTRKKPNSSDCLSPSESRHALLEMTTSPVPSFRSLR